MYCRQCGQPLSEGARFCAACGSPVAVPAAPGAEADPAPAPEGYAAVPADPSGEPPPPLADPAAGRSSSDPFGTLPPHAPTPPRIAPAMPFPSGVPAGLPEPRYAGFWRRFWGLFIDRFALGIVLFPVGLMFGLNVMWPFTHEGGMTPELLKTIIFGSISVWLVRSFLEWVYFSAFHSSPLQATPGQMVLGLRVIGLDGGRIGFARASGRYFASWLSAVIFLVGFIMGAFTVRKQTLHDMIAGTLVLHGPRGGT